MVTFTGIPDGVMVMVPAMVPVVDMVDDPEEEGDEMILDPAAFSLVLREGTRVDGVGGYRRGNHAGSSRA